MLGCDPNTPCGFTNAFKPKNDSLWESDCYFLHLRKEGTGTERYVTCLNSHS